jgi:hypothetical protein
VSNLTVSQQAQLVEQRLRQELAQRGDVNQMQAIAQVTTTALSQISGVHRHAVDSAKRTLEEAERVQRGAGKSLDDSTFQSATSTYIARLTYITEAAGIDIIRVIDTTFR